MNTEPPVDAGVGTDGSEIIRFEVDRKSTRLNSSHRP